MPDARLADPVAVEPQPFEAGIFGAPVWRVEVKAGADGGDIADVVARARREGVVLMFSRVPEGADSIDLLRGAGFRAIDQLVTFERDLPDGPATPTDLARPEEADIVAAIGGSVFVHGRHHADPSIPNAIADEIKRQWVWNGVRGRADAPIVVRVDGAIAGFNLCMRRGEVAVIDLIGVARTHQRHGIGRRLVRSGLAHYAGACARMRVGTQATNVPSMALYESEGFVRVAASETFHWTPSQA